MPNKPAQTTIHQLEREVEERSAVFKKQLGLFDLVLTQVVFVVGTIWVGHAAKLGSEQSFFWILAIALFYLPLAAAVIFLNRLAPLEGGLYQWAKLAFNDFVAFLVAWNLWVFAISILAGIGLVVTTNISYAIGPPAAWMKEAKLLISLVPNFSTYNINVFSKLALGALTGFEYVAILAGETKAPAKNIARSVVIAAPIIAFMFILGTSSVLAFVTPATVDLISPIPQVLSIGFGSFGWVGKIISLTILGVVMRQIALMSIYFAGNTRLPMVAGWDSLLPKWFTGLHPKYKTPVNSILFVGAVTLVLGILSLSGVGAQEAFQLLDNAGGVFYACTYLVLFAIPIFGMKKFGVAAPLWLKIACASGFIVTLIYIGFTVVPIIDVVSWFQFAIKIVLVVVLANAVGVLLYWIGKRRARI
jgi:amino acid transporter